MPRRGNRSPTTGSSCFPSRALAPPSTDATITLDEISFRPLTRADFVLIGAWLKQPHVARWWRDPSDPESIEAEYGPVVDGADRAEVFVVELSLEPIGLIDRYLTRNEREWQRALASTGVPLDSAGIG
jgi:hypothetical protein